MKERPVRKYNIGDIVKNKHIEYSPIYKIKSYTYIESQSKYKYEIYNIENTQHSDYICEDDLQPYSAQQVCYNTREWLNPLDSPSTGSITCFYGLTQYSDGLDTNGFIELSDCHQKARIHKTFSDTLDDWINKVEKLQINISNYLNYLKKYKEQ